MLKLSFFLFPFLVQTHFIYTCIHLHNSYIITVVIKKHVLKAFETSSPLLSLLHLFAILHWSGARSGKRSGGVV